MPSNLESRIATLSAPQQALLRERLARGDEPGQPAAAPTEGRRAELSFGQRRLWFLDRLEGGGPLYNIARAWWLKGPVDVDRLRDAFARLMARHEALRTVFPSEDGQPWQQVLPHLPAELPLTDFSAFPPEVARERTLTLAQTLAVDPFNLEQAPLARLALVRTTASTHLLVLVMHHIISDGWSLSVFYRELSVFYAGDGAALAPLPIQYADYAEAQRAGLNATTLGPQLAYWRRKLAGLAPLELPTDRPRPPHQSHRGVRERNVLPAELSATLKQISRRERVTFFMLLLAAYQVLLSRYTGQDDIAVGSPIAGRTRGEIEGLIGFFVNTIVLRTDLSGNPRFCDLLARVRETALDAYAHQDAPFDRLVEDLSPERDVSRSPLIQSVFVLQNMPQTDLVMPQVDVTIQDLDTRTAKFDLTVQLFESPDGLRVAWEYATDLFEPATITRMAGHFQRLLEAIAADPTQHLSDLPLLTNLERRRLLTDWNDTAADYPATRAVQELFEDEAARVPGAVAISAANGDLTYGALNARANQLAHHLRTLGVEPNAVVGLCLDRGSDMVTAMLAVLKAGAAYLPLEPDQPAERTSLILREAGASVLVTAQRFLENTSGAAIRSVCLDRDAAAIDRAPSGNRSGMATGDSRAYVIYTSGSTGMPKGVAVPHKAVTRLVLSTNYVTLTRTDVIAQASNCSFDAATFEVWGALLNGARMVVVPKDVLLSPKSLTAAIARHGITTLFVTTALFNRVASDAPAAFNGVRQLLFGGEAVDPAAVRRVLEAGAPVNLIHVYGPTEATTFATSYLVESVAPDATTVPIGRPIANTTIYLLDRVGHPSPVGIPGEIHIGGPGVAEGYLNQPALTSETFLPDPFASEPGARLYRTGDLARYRADGNIEFLGRLDGQVKLRGFRVEPGEIEAALRCHPHVSAAAVVVQPDASGERRLVAYVVSDGAIASLTSELRAFLGRKLPHYMVPSAYVPLDALPLTPNGKVDRDALPAPLQERPDLATPFHEAADDLEATLIAIWEKVLGTRPIGVDDNFFDLGGNSLLALLLINRIEHACHAVLPPVVLFEAPTVAQLAYLLRTRVQPAPGSPLVAIQPEGSLPPLFCIHGGGGHVLGYADLARHLGPDQPVFGLQAVGLDGRRMPHLSLPEMAAEYVAEIRRIRPEGPYHLTGLSFGGVVAFEMARQLAEQGQRVGLLALLDASRPGHFQSLSKAARLANYGRRLRYHWTRVVLGPDRRIYLGHKLTTIKRRTRDRVWHLFYLPYKVSGKELPAVLRRVTEANRMALRTYTPRPYRGRLTLFVASERVISLHRLSDLGWGPYAEGGVETHEVAGDHVSLITEPSVRVLAEHMRQSLARAN